ncbi:hypothetical protein C8R47DRAFT_1070041 [Mycena vitilis]|nr:hypothetical protein C8R47DRAFT_1070041 [Mycena vitilis]
MAPPVTIEEVEDEGNLTQSIAAIGLPFADNGLDELNLLFDRGPSLDTPQPMASGCLSSPDHRPVSPESCSPDGLRPSYTSNLREQQPLESTQVRRFFDHDVEASCWTFACKRELSLPTYAAERGSYRPTKPDLIRGSSLYHIPPHRTCAPNSALNAPSQLKPVVPLKPCSYQLEVCVVTSCGSRAESSRRIENQSVSITPPSRASRMTHDTSFQWHDLQIIWWCHFGTDFAASDVKLPVVLQVICSPLRRLEPSLLQPALTDLLLSISVEFVLRSHTLSRLRLLTDFAAAIHRLRIHLLESLNFTASALTLEYQGKGDHCRYLQSLLGGDFTYLRRLKLTLKIPGELEGKPEIREVIQHAMADVPTGSGFARDQGNRKQGKTTKKKEKQLGYAMRMQWPSSPNAAAEPAARRPFYVLDNVNPGFNDLGDLSSEHQYIASETIPLYPTEQREPLPTAWTPPISQLYGRPQVLPAEKPDLMSEAFMWEDAEISRAPRPSPSLAPAPAAEPPAGYTYPQAEVYNLTPTLDRRFTRGCAYVTLFTPSKRGLLHSRLLRTKTPPNVVPRLYDSKIVVDPIAGMIQMPGSIPFVQHVEGHPDEVVTMACAHTLPSIRQAYPNIADSVERLATELYNETFGCEATEDHPKMLPIYSIAGLKRNDRSVDAKDLPEGSFDGSYNLASTKGEGEGAGCVMPAVQASTPEAAERIGHVLRLLHAIQRYIMPRSISKFEHDVTEAHSELNNVVSFGGLAPNATSCQMNVSSGGFDLAHFIGAHQGSWHTDIGDDWTRWTMVTMVLKLPEVCWQLIRIGSDPGAFCLARCGLYVREADAWIVFLVFRGNDLHSGFAPTSPPIPVADINALANLAGPNRVVYVSYPSRVATTRAGSMSMSPPTNFWNFGTTSAAKAEQRHYSDSSSTQVFGSVYAKVNRLAREAAHSFSNALTYSGIKLNISLTDLMTGMTYTDADGRTENIEPPPFDIDQHAPEMSRWWRFYEWHRNLCNTYLIRITKNEYKQAQQDVESGKSETARSVQYAVLERVPAAVAVTVDPAPILEVALEHVVDSITQRKVLDGKTTWFLKVDSKDEVVTVDGSAPWIHHARNAPKFAQFIANSHVTGSNPIAMHTTVSGVPLPDVTALPSPVSVDPAAIVSAADMGCTVPSASSLLAPSAVVVAGTGIPTTTSETGDLLRQSQRLRSGQKDKEVTMDVDGNSADESFVIEDIVDIDLEGLIWLHLEMEPRWRVRWQGYTEEEDEWKTLTELRDAQELLDAFNKKIDYKLPSPIPISPRASPSPSVGSNYIPDIVAITTRGTKRSYASESDISEPDEEDQLEDPEAVICLQPDKLVDLEKLFDPEFRQLEMEALATTEESLQRNKQYFAPTTTTSIIESLVTQNELQSAFNDYMSFVPKAVDSRSWTQHSAVLSLQRVVQATNVLPDLIINETKTAILDRSLRWEIARSHLLIYSWYKDTGPQLAETLMELHKSGYSNTQGGYPIVLRTHPAFAQIVHHIVSYVIAQADQKREVKKAKRRNAGAIPRNRAPLHPQCPFPIPPTELGSLPYDLYGLRAGPAKSKRIPLSLPHKNVGLHSADAVYQCSATILQTVWSTELILPSIASMEKSLSKQRKADIDAVKCRAVTRGAVLQCIVDACGGDESILASSDIEAILTGPSKMFPSRITKESRFAAAVLKDPQTTLAPLADWLARRLDEHPTILDFSTRTARIVHRGLLELHYGVTLSEEHYLNPNLLYDESEDTPFIAPAANRKSTKRKNTYYAAPTPETLVPDTDAPYLGAIGLLLRERCNELRDLKAADPLLRNVLQGRHPTQGRVQFDRDQTDPARQFSQYAKMLEASLPPNQLTGRLGISWLLAYMGTGQGNKTSAFALTGLDPKNNKFPMAFRNLGDCVAHFEAAELSNIGILADNRTKPGARAAQLSGYKQTYNACIWGQASNHLLLQPTLGKGKNKRKYTLEQKFAPYFSSIVQDMWCVFLGDLVNKDPRTYTGTKKTWADALRFILDLKVLGFQSGLTPLQFANNLVFLGICTPPSAEEVGSWIASNKGLGAYNGLVQLGFALTGHASIVAAYTVVYNHLNAHLSCDDKRILGFGTLFVEHVLCKVGRWEYRLRLQKHKFFLMASQAKETQGDSWIQGANSTDHLAFPIPLSISRANIQAAINSCMATI